jgi:NAD(P)-dependent dehydrogenase (short-subunit alcohol dehydrogenase family)
MVSEDRSVRDIPQRDLPRHVVIAGSDSPVGAALVAHYRALGSGVSELPIEGDYAEAAAAVSDPVDLLVIADGIVPPARRLGALERHQLAASMQRLTFRPFHIATLLRPLLAEAKGTMVLLTRREAVMETPDPDGRYLDRPFRAAAHQLWRSLSVEWRPDGISCRLIALDRPDTHPVTIASAIAAEGTEGPVVMTGHEGEVIGW